MTAENESTEPGINGGLMQRERETVPAAGKAEVLIKVKAAGVNPVDWKICEGRLSTHFPHRFPLIPG